MLDTFSRALAGTALLGASALLPGTAMAGWTNLPISSDYTPYVSSARVCKTLLGTVYGPLWYVNYQVFRRDTRVYSISAMTVRWTPPNIQFFNTEANNQWLYGVVAGTGRRVYASPYYDDRFSFNVNFSSAVYVASTGRTTTVMGWQLMKPGEIANC